MITIEIYKDRNDNYYVQTGDYKVRIGDGTRHDGTTIGHFELVKKLTIPAVSGRRELLVCPLPDARCDRHKIDDEEGRWEFCNTCKREWAR